MESYESVLLVKPEVFVFNIPPRSTNRGYRAADWNLTEPSWTGRLRLVTMDGKCSIKLEDKTTGELFAKCPIETYPGIAVEAVNDSSRYFVLRIQDDNGRTAFIGLGFGDRSDSFDLNVSLQDHFKWLKKEHQLKTETPGPELDLRFKEGETIKINMKITKKDGSEVSSRTKSKAGNSGILAPPPGSNKIAPPPGSGKVTPAGSPAHNAIPRPLGESAGGDSWGEFTSGENNTEPSTATAAPINANWVQF